MSSDGYVDGAIAIVGLACRVPGAETPGELWRILRDGEDAIRRFTEDELLAAGVPLEQIRSPSYVPAKGVVADADCFDAALFGLSPREAALVDPQQRVFLECAWTALEDAGYDPQRVAEPVGVFAGSILSIYLLQNLWSNPGLTAAAGNFQVAVGNDPTFLATSTSYHLGLSGPSISVGTACSTSLVAVHLACQSLLARECDMALAGAVSIHLPLVAGYHYENGGILSPDGRCRPFSADARGTVSSDGAGVVVLKRLTDAVADGDSIRAVIRASAINNDGRSKVGFTAPSVTGEAQVIGEALAMADVAPESLVMIETHGAGTLLGDPIEVEALKLAFGDVPGKAFCALGSVKANLGHLDAAAGIAGLIKATLSLEHREIPPVPHFDTPNPRLELDSSPFYVNRDLRPMPGGRPLRVGVSSFGIGGTNVHVVLEQAPPPPSSRDAAPRPAYRHDLLMLSARSAEALERSAERLARFLDEAPAADFADVCFTLRRGRRQLEHRRAVVCSDAAEAASLLRAGDSGRPATGRVADGTAPQARRSVAFMMPGLGDHYPAMGWQLYCEEPTFRAVIDRCSELLAPRLPGDLRDFLYPQRPWSAPVWRPEGGAAPSTGLDLAAMLGRAKTPPGAGPPEKGESAPIVAQPMIFVTELALAQLLLGWGIEPRAMIGHSIGELAVACCAGVLDLPQALELVAERARLIQERVEPGAMLAVPMAERELRPLLPDGVDLGAVNGSALCVASGEIAGIAALESALAEREVQCRRLRSSHAFHSRMMEAIVEPLAAVVRRLTLRPPEIPYVSCLTGDWIRDEEATDPDYWARHVCRTVRFKDGLDRLFEDPDRILLEVGPGQGLTSHAVGERARDPERRQPVLATMRWSYDRREESEVLLGAVANLWVAGVELDARFRERPGARRVPLPTYPFERRRHWIAPGQAASAGQGARVTGKNPDLSRWFYLPAWKPSVAPAATSLDESLRGDWLLFAGPGAPAWLGTLEARLAEAGARVLRVEPGAELAWTDGGRITVPPDRAEGFAELVRALGERDRRPTRVIHAWSLTGTDPSPPSTARFATLQARGFGGMMALLRSLSRQPGGLAELRFDLLADRLFAVGEQDDLMPEKATLEALALVAPQEHPGLVCRCVDVGGADEVSDDERVEQVLRELRAPATEAAVAYRRGRRWVRFYEPVEIPAAAGRPTLRHRGVYLLTGGLGGVGLILARFLASRYRARLALLGRTVLPDRRDWPAVLASAGTDEPMRARIRAVQELEASGGEVMVLSTDVAEEGALAGAIQEIEARFGELHGVIHGAGLPGVDACREIVEASPADWEAQFRAKVHGVLELDRALAGRRLDFCVLMSSLSAILGGLGFAGYSAANLFLDAFAAWRNRAGAAAGGPQTPWISIDWESWRQPGSEPVIRGLGATVSDLTMEPEEGAEALVRVLSQPRWHQVVVSCGDLRARLDQWTTQDRQEPPSAAATVHERPELASAYVAPRNELERQLATIWGELFGLAEVGVEDDFFALGGHSLLATQLNARLYSVLGVEMSLATLLQTTTIGELAEAVAERQFEQSDPEELAALLAEVGAMGAEESRRMLAGEPAIDQETLSR